MADRAGAGEAEQAADRALDLPRVSLALPDQHDAAVAVQQVEARPGAVAPGAPGAEAVVLADRERDAELAHRRLDVAAHPLEAEFRRVDADHLQPGHAVL
jgi:hypothetical protein